MLSDNALKNIQACLSDLDELICGRFIFAENMISKILQDISQSNEIYALISECMKNFNFDKEFNRAKVKLPTKDGYFIMPESKAIVLPLVFCIFVDIRDKKINFRDFLKNYFQSEGIGEFENFAQTVVRPFRDSISYCFGMDKNSQDFEKEDIPKIEENEQQLEKNLDKEKVAQQEIKQEKLKNENQAKIFENIEQICEQMKQNLSQERHIKQSLKEDIEFLLNAMTLCAKKYDITNLSAYVVALNYIVKQVGGLRFLYIELKDVLAKYYEN